MYGFRRCAGGLDPPRNITQNIWCPSNTATAPLIVTKLPSQHSMLDHYRYTSDSPFKWRFIGMTDDGPLIGGQTLAKRSGSALEFRSHGLCLTVRAVHLLNWTSYTWSSSDVIKCQCDVIM